MTLLSGTPTPNNYLDLWSQLYLLDKGEALGKHYTKFRHNYFYPVDYMQYKWVPKNPDDIFNKVKHLVCTIKPEDCVSLPEKINVITKVNIPAKSYEDLKNKYILSDNEQTVAATRNNILLNKLAQYCGGAVYETDEDVSLKTIHIHDAKLDALETIIENNPNENILVAYKYKSDLIRLQNRFKHAQVLTIDNIAEWNSGKVKLMLCQPASCSMGLNLQFGGSTIVWFSMTWNLEHYLQFNGRLHRHGQTKPVVINHLVAKLPKSIKTVDEIIFNSLQLKNISQDKLMNELIKDL
jgi:SNF2 family DNA or RNA helicase